jgi:hypothetical protein
MERNKEAGVMDICSINLLVKDPDAALATYTRLFGTNNIHEALRIKGLNNGYDVVDGYYLKTQPMNLGIWTPRKSDGKMGRFLQNIGEGIHHLTFQLDQDEFESTYARFKNEGKPVSERVTYVGKLSEAIFWLDGEGEQGVPLQFGTKCYRGLQIWDKTDYLDTPQKIEPVKIPKKLSVLIILNTVIDSRRFRSGARCWSSIIS